MIKAAIKSILQKYQGENVDNLLTSIPLFVNTKND